MTDPTIYEDGETQDSLATEEVELYPEVTDTNYAAIPAANSTLTMFYGLDNKDFNAVANDMAIRSPAQLAKERAELARVEEGSLIKDAAVLMAQAGNSAGVQEALKEYDKISKPKEESFYSDVNDSVNPTIERLMVTSGKSKDEILAMASVYSNNFAVRTALEVSLHSLDKRSNVGQLAQDVVGLTTLEDWTRLSPIVNEELEKVGFTGSRTLTKTTAVSNFLEALQAVPSGDRVKLITTVVDRLTSVIGQKDTARFLESALSVGEDPNIERVFGTLDALGIAAIIKGGTKAILKATKPSVAASTLGYSDQVALDIAGKITDNQSVFGISNTEAADAAVTANALISKETAGLAPSVQQQLQARLKATIEDLERTLYTGGASQAEVMATKQRLESIYSKSNNPNIITSTVTANPTKGNVGLDVLYGNSAGKPFDTAEEALAYYKNWKAGNLEVVPVGGTAEDIAAAVAKADEEVASAINEAFQLKYAPRTATSSTVGELQKSPLFNFPRAASTDTQAIPAVISNGVPVREAWASIRDKALGYERLVVDNLINTLPDTTKVVIRQGDGRAMYLGASDTIVVYRNAADSNVFTHELIHAVTSNKIAYGKLNPSSNIGKIVTKMDTLRNEVVKNLGKVKDPDLLADLKYLTSNIDEFSTSGLWSINQLPKVAAFLDGIKYQNTTLLSKIWESFKELLGFGNKDTALSEWFGLTEDLSKQGLRVTLPEKLTLPDGRVVALKDRERLYPSYANNKKTGVALQKLEDAVSDRVGLDPTMSPPASGFYVRQKVDMPVFTQDISKISQDELDKMHMLVGKINPRLASTNSIYGPALTSMYKATKYGKLYSDFIKTSFDKLNSTSIDKVNGALIKTEKLKRDMTVLELAEAGVKTEAEQEAYYSFRTMRNLQYYYKNKEAVRALTAQGNIHVFVGMDELGELSGPAKHVTLTSRMGKKVFDVENNKFVTVTESSIKEMDSRGVQFYEYAKAQNLNGHKSSITAIAVPPSKVRTGDITSVVGRVDGAYSRIYEEEYFIKLKGQQLVDDTPTESLVTFRTAATEADAAAYVKGFNDLLAIRASGKLLVGSDVSRALKTFEGGVDELALRINSGEFDGFKAQFNYTRLEDNFFRDVTGVGADVQSDGRVFWSGRSEESIKSITKGGLDAETLGPLQSLEAEISNTARFTATNEWRRNAIQRWYNTFEDVISESDKLRGTSAEDVFFSVVNNVKGYALSDAKARQMIANKDFILNQLAVKTADEKVIQHAINNLTSNLTWPGFSHVGHVIRKADVLEWAKSVNSTLMLGLFSASQLVVQSSGMLLATTISPKHGLKAAFSIRPILAALTSDNASVWKYLHKITNVEKMAGMNMDDFARVAASIKRIGLLDNIGASSVYNGADGQLNIFSRNKAKFNQAQMMFFNKGEEINRVGAFEIARREFIEANPGVLWDADDALQKIVLRADDLSMNMSRVNEARISKGVLGIPLQFLQHNIRLGTNIYSSLAGAVSGKGSTTLSAKEAFTLTLGSYLLYGVNNNATPDFIEEWLGKELNGKLSETEKQYLTQGILSGLISSIGEALTGERTNIALGSRLSSIQWYEDLGDAVFNLFKGEKVDVAKLAGPTGSTLTALLDLPEIFLDYRHKDEWTLSEFARTVSTAGATMVSSWRNIDKAYWAYHANGMVLSKRGDTNAVLTRPEMFFQFLGFQSTEAHESSSVFNTKREYAATMQRYADTIMRLEGLARKAYLANDEAAMRDNYAGAEAVLAPLPLADQQFIKRLIRQTTTYDTVGREAFNKWAVDFSSHKNKLLVTNPYGE